MPNGSTSTPGRSVAALEAISLGVVALTNLALAEAGQDITFAQWRVLMIVATRDGGARISEIAVHLGLAVSATSKLVRRAERRGLVRVTTDAGDRRARRVHLTAAGAELRDVVLAGRRRHLEQVVAEVGSPGAAATAFLERLGRSLATRA